MSETLDLHRLGDGSTHKLDSIDGQYIAAAASVCLEEKEHQQGCEFHVTGRGFDFRDTGLQAKSYRLVWPPAQDATRRSHKTGQNAIEHGACGMAVLLAYHLTEYQVVEQSRRRGGPEGGFDYWLSETEEISFDARLEVSGILKGTMSQVNARVKEKLAQTDQSDGMSVPAFVVVVEFGTPRAVLVKK